MSLSRERLPSKKMSTALEVAYLIGHQNKKNVKPSYSYKNIAYSKNFREHNSILSKSQNQKYLFHLKFNSIKLMIHIPFS